MEDENKTPESESTPEGMDASAYVDALNKIKENMVDKTKYDKLAEDNKKLVEALASGSHFEEEEEEKGEPSSDIAKRIFKNSKRYRNDLEFFTDALAYRDALIEEGQVDPFLPFNHDYAPDEDDVQKAQDIADALKECVEYAQGDPKLFTSELMRRGVKINTVRR